MEVVTVHYTCCRQVSTMKSVLSRQLSVSESISQQSLVLLYVCRIRELMKLVKFRNLPRPLSCLFSKL